MELQQIRMKLTSDSEVIKQLHENKQFHKDGDAFFIPIMFNSQEIRFRVGDVKTLERDVAKAIYRRAFVIVGDQLTGEIKPMFDIVEEFDLGTKISAPKFACPECGADQNDARELAAHLATHFTEPEPPQVETDDQEPEAEPVAASPSRGKYFSKRGQAAE